MTTEIIRSSKNFLWDVFLSYHRTDRDVVLKLAERLRKSKLRVWFDEWMTTPDTSFFNELQQGISRSRTQVLCMSAVLFQSEWPQVESLTATFRDPLNKHRRFIPLLLEDCVIPDTIRRYTYLDYRARTPKQFKDLVIACRAPKPTAQRELHRDGYLLGHESWISDILVTPDGLSALTASWDSNLILWDLVAPGDGGKRGVIVKVFREHTDRINSCAISGITAVSASNDGTIRLWNLSTGRCSRVLKLRPGRAYAVVMLSNAKHVIFGGEDGWVRLWDLEAGRTLALFKHEGKVNCLALSRDEKLLVSGSEDATARVWDIRNGNLLAELKGHEKQIRAVAISSDNRLILTGALDSTVRLWDRPIRRCLGVFEGHSSRVESVSFSFNSQLALSSGNEGARIWRIPSGECLLRMELPFGASTFLPDGTHFLTGMRNGVIAVWPISVIPKSSLDSVRYSNAKVVLLGESGVGKTGLANRLIYDRYTKTDSTHGMNVERIVLPEDARSSIEREVWLWDLAGQDDYRLIHQLFLDETAVALMVINPQADDPFERVEDWLKALRTALRNADHDPARLLIAARVDQGGFKVSEDKIKSFLHSSGIKDSLQTSAKTGKNCSDKLTKGTASELKKLIADHIPWEHLPFISTDRILRELKNAVLARASNQDTAIVRFTELMQQIVTAFPNELIHPNDVRKAVRLLGNQGVIQPLDFGDLILLRPALLNDYASAVIRAARQHTDEIGCVSEKEILDAHFDLTNVSRIERADELLLLRAMVQTFLDRSLCMAEETIDGRQLIFPSQFRRDRPISNVPDTIVTYSFGAELPTVFTTLVVRLWYSRAFDNKEIWQNAAEFLAKGNGAKIGFVMVNTGQGTGRISVFAEPTASEDQKVIFIEFLHQHLLKNAIDIKRERRYVCNNAKCRKPVNDVEAVQARLAAGRTYITCSYCDKKVTLIDVIEQRASSDQIARKVREMDEEATKQLDNQAREQILIGHMMAICGEANQIFRPTTFFDYGIDGEVEFKGNDGRPSGKKIYVQLKSGDSFLRLRETDDRLIFDVQSERHLKYWRSQPCEVYLVIRATEGEIQWMNLTSYLNVREDKLSKQVEFAGKRLDAFAIMRMRDRLVPLGKSAR